MRHARGIGQHLPAFLVAWVEVGGELLVVYDPVVARVFCTAWPVVASSLREVRCKRVWIVIKIAPKISDDRLPFLDVQSPGLIYQVEQPSL